MSGYYDHEIKVGSTTTQLKLLKDENGQPMYRVLENIPKYLEEMKIIQRDYKGGHGQFFLEDNDVYFEGQSVDTTIEGKLFLGPLINEVQEVDDTALDSAPVCFVWFPGATVKWLCATAGKIYRYDVASSGKWTAATTTLAGVTQMAVHNGVCYACMGASTKYYYSTDGDTWTITDLTDGYANKIYSAPNAAGTTMVMWKYKTPNEVSSTTDGRTVAGGGVQWSSPAYIGDTAKNINNIFWVSGTMLVGKDDNLYEYDSDGGVHALRDDLKVNASTNNFKYVAGWQTAAYHSEENGMGEVTSTNTYYSMGPLTKIDDIGKVGTIIGIASDKDFLYVATDEGTNNIIYKGREVRRGGGLRWEWCPWVFLGTNACTTIAVAQHSTTDRRLWFGYGTKTGYVTITDNPLSDSTATFAASGNIRMSYVYGTNLYWDKLIQSVVTQTQACTANITVTPKYRINAETSDTALTAAITTNGTVKTNLSAELAFNRISLSLYLATNSSTVTPIVTYFEVRGVEKPETVRIHECVYESLDTPERRSETVRTALRNARTSTALVRFADHWFKDNTADGGGYVWVVLQPGSPEEVVVLATKERQPTLGLKCRWQEVSFTIT